MVANLSLTDSTDDCLLRCCHIHVVCLPCSCKVQEPPAHCCDSNQVAVVLQMVQIELEQSEAYVKELQGQSAENQLRTTNKVI